MKQTDFPQWAQDIKKSVGGTTLRQIGGIIYLYKGTSRRVPGKKNPVMEETYMGIVAEDGFIPAEGFMFYPLQTECLSIDRQFKLEYQTEEDQNLLHQMSIIKRKGKYFLPRVTDLQMRTVEKYFTVKDGEIIPI